MTRREQLADYYIKATGIVAVCVQPAGPRPAVGIVTDVGYRYPAGLSLFCCARECDAIAIAADASHRLATDLSHETAATAVAAAAADHGVALTPHAIVAARASAVVAQVERAMDEMRANGGLRALNQRFKAARLAGERIVYADWLHRQKEAMLAMLVRGGSSA